MPRYEFSLGVFVDAENEQEAWEKVQPASALLDKIDAEGDSAIEGPTLVPWKEPATEDDAKMLVRQGILKSDSYVVGDDGGVYRNDEKEPS